MGKLAGFFYKTIYLKIEDMPIFAPSQRWQEWHSFYFAGMLTLNDGINAYIQILTYLPTKKVCRAAK